MASTDPSSASSDDHDHGHQPHGPCTSTPSSTPFTMRIVSLDSYHHPAEEDAQQLQLWGEHPHPAPFHPQLCDPRTVGIRLPVIRLFGVTPGGQKACLHVHHVLPYLYIPYRGPPLQGALPCNLERYLYQVGMSVNHALALYLGRPALGYEHHGANQVVGSVQLVRGIPFYGYHAGYDPFLKLSLLRPEFTRHVVHILESGSVMGIPFQTLESHIAYLPQFFIDYNLYGMELIQLDDFRFRGPIYPGLREAETAAAHSPLLYTQRRASEAGQCWPAGAVERTSFCELELDTWACFIANRHRVTERAAVPLLPPGLGEEALGSSSPTPATSLPSTGRLVPSLLALWEEEARRRKQCLGHDSPMPPALTQSKERMPPPWPNEAELAGVLRAAIGALDPVAASAQAGALLKITPELAELPTTFACIGRLYAPAPALSSAPASPVKPPSSSADMSQDYGSWDAPLSTGMMDALLQSHFSQLSQCCPADVDLARLATMAQVGWVGGPHAGPYASIAGACSHHCSHRSYTRADMRTVLAGAPGDPAARGRGRGGEEGSDGVARPPA
jgi:hypothetical protein